MRPRARRRAVSTEESETLVQERADVPPGQPPRRPPPPLLWPWLLALLLLVAAGLVALWLFNRDDNDHSQTAAAVTVPNVVRQKQSVAVNRLRQAGPGARDVPPAGGLAAGAGL